MYRQTKNAARQGRLPGEDNCLLYNSSKNDVRFGPSLPERDRTTKLWVGLFSVLTSNFVECLVRSVLCLHICLHSSIDSVLGLSCAHSRNAMS